MIPDQQSLPIARDPMRVKDIRERLADARREEYDIQGDVAEIDTGLLRDVVKELDRCRVVWKAEPDPTNMERLAIDIENMKEMLDSIIIRRMEKITAAALGVALSCESVDRTGMMPYEAIYYNQVIDRAKVALAEAVTGKEAGK